jgi:hypothetical protein
MRSLTATLTLCLALAGCSGGGTDPATATTDCKSIDPVREVSQSCCPEWGVDACGAGLFCAAFDGRTMPTCYPLYSQRGLQGCTDDSHCASRACNPTTHLCKSGFMSEDCTSATGCVDDYACRNACPGYSTACSATCRVPCELRCITP